MISYVLLSLHLTLRMGGLLQYSEASWTHAAVEPIRQKILAIGRPALPYLEQALNDPKVANWVVAETYGQIGGTSSYPLLRELAESNLPPVSSYAVVGLGYTKDRRALPLLFERLKSKRFQECAAEALGYLGYTEAVPSLAKLLDEGTDGDGPYSLGRICAISLSKLGHPGAIALAKALNDPDSSDQVCRRAAEALELSKDPDTKEDLAKFLRSDGSERAKAPAIYALSLLKDPRAFPYALNLAESNDWCTEGYESLLALGDERSLSIVRKGVSGPERRAQGLIGALQTSKGPAAVPLLLQLVRRPEPEIQRSAIYALNAIGDPAAVPVLEHLWPTAGDRYGDIEAALAKMGHSGVGALIRIYRKRPDQGKTGGLLQLLGETGDPAAIPILKEALNDPISWVREMAQEAIRRIVLRY